MRTLCVCIDYGLYYVSQAYANEAAPCRTVGNDSDTKKHGASTYTAWFCYVSPTCYIRVRSFQPKYSRLTVDAYRRTEQRIPRTARLPVKNHRTFHKVMSCGCFNPHTLTYAATYSHAPGRDRRLQANDSRGRDIEVLAAPVCENTKIDRSFFCGRTRRADTQKLEASRILEPAIFPPSVNHDG